MWFLWFLIGKNCNCNQFPPKFEFSGQQLTFRHFLAILVFLAFFEKIFWGFFWNSKFEFLCQTTKFHFLSFFEKFELSGIFGIFWKNIFGNFFEIQNLNFYVLVGNIRINIRIILEENLKIQANFKVRFLRRNDKLTRIKNF